MKKLISLGLVFLFLVFLIIGIIGLFQEIDFLNALINSGPMYITELEKSYLEALKSLTIFNIVIYFVLLIYLAVIAYRLFVMDLEKSLYLFAIFSAIYFLASFIENISSIALGKNMIAGYTVSAIGIIYLILTILDIIASFITIILFRKGNKNAYIFGGLAYALWFVFSIFVIVASSGGTAIQIIFAVFELLSALVGVLLFILFGTGVLDKKSIAISSPVENAKVNTPETTTTDISSKLRDIKRLKDEGILTDEEYEEKRKALVNKL